MKAEQIKEKIEMLRYEHKSCQENIIAAQKQGHYLNDRIKSDTKRMIDINVELRKLEKMLKQIGGKK